MCLGKLVCIRDLRNLSARNVGNVGVTEKRWARVGSGLAARCICCNCRNGKQERVGNHSRLGVM